MKNYVNEQKGLIPLCVLVSLSSIKSYVSAAQGKFRDPSYYEFLTGMIGMISIALYQPDIPQNVGAMIRLTACLGIDLHIIEPCGFPWDDRKIRQSAMDYKDGAILTRHSSWQAFKDFASPRRIILMTTKSDLTYINYRFQSGDILLAGRESSGVPENVHEQVDARITIPLKPGMRSLNIAVASAMVTAEALRQTEWMK